MKYINVFSTEERFNEVSAGLSRPQLAVAGDKVFSLSGTPGGGDVYEMHYTTTDGLIFDVSAVMDMILEMIPIEDASVNHVISNTSDGEKWTLRCEKPIEVVGIDGEIEDCSGLGPIFGWYDTEITSNLKSVMVPDSVNRIGEMAFEANSQLTVVNIPEGVTIIGDSALSNCRSLSEIEIPDSVTHIGHYAFSDCRALTEIVIPDSVETVGEYVFDQCMALQTATIGNSLTAIGDNMFANCSALTAITIPDSVTQIGSNAFDACVSMLSAVIGSSVSQISQYAFRGCTAMTVITSLNTTPPVLGDAVFLSVPSTTPVRVPSTAVAAYQAANGWKDMTIQAL